MSEPEISPPPEPSVSQPTIPQPPSRKSVFRGPNGIRADSWPGPGRLRGGMSATEEDIVEFCRGQIAHYKVPRYVRFVESFPLTISGKVQKYLIREQLRAQLGLADDEHA